MVVFTIVYSCSDYEHDDLYHGSDPYNGFMSMAALTMIMIMMMVHDTCMRYYHLSYYDYCYYGCI